MCHNHNSHVPVTPIAGASVDSEDIVLRSADGTDFAAMVARSSSASSLGMVVIPDIRGLYPFYEELAMRFAEEGINSVAFDFFGRTAGVGKRDADFPWMEHIPKTTVKGVTEDVAASIAYLKSPAGGNCTKIFTVGFCFGGSLSWLQTTAGHGVAGAIGFYGRPSAARDGSPGPTQRAAEFEAPILGLMGGADQGITQDLVEEFRSALNAAGKRNEIVVYEGAPHSFFDRTFDEHKTACDDAWKRILAFVKEDKL